VQIENPTNLDVVVEFEQTYSVLLDANQTAALLSGQE
jgi:hypothetical protein